MNLMSEHVTLWRAAPFDGGAEDEMPPTRAQGELRKAVGEEAEQMDPAGRRSCFFSLSVDMLGTADFGCRFQQLNPSWERTLGFTAEELRQKSAFEVVHPDDRRAMSEQMRQLQKRNTTTYFEARCVRKDGSCRWLGWTAASVVAERTVYLFVRDITLRKVAEQEVQKLHAVLANRAADLEKANRELQREIGVRKQAEAALKESNAELEAFAYTVSHDLRAPLRSMQGFAQALVEDCAGELRPEGLDYAQRIVAAATRLDRLIQDLLTYSRITHARLEREPVDLHLAVSSALAQLESPLRESAARIIIRRPLGTVLGHHATLVQVIGNLLANAIKFVKPGARPEVQVRAEPTREWLRLWIEDDGIGIPPEFQTRIFRVFERLHGVETYAGTGVGLAIVRKGLERMGGRVGVESVPQQGSRFWLELPRV